MNYESIQNLRRNIIAGRYVAPDNFRVVYPIPRRKRKVVQNDENETENNFVEWDEGAYQDDFYDNEERDVAPDYFHDCDQLVTSYAKGDDMLEDLSIRPLFTGSLYSSKDLARFLLSFKARHLKVGDGILANIVAILATFLPPDNTFKASLPEKPTIYFLLKALDNLASYTTNLRTLKIDCCIKKCTGYYAGTIENNFCSVCNECRWKLCSHLCYDVAGQKVCQHLQSSRRSLYYNVVQDRLVKLLKSDIKNLFNYQAHRAGKLTYCDGVCPDLS